MKSFYYPLLLLLLCVVSCKKDKISTPTPITSSTASPKITSAEYVDSLLFVNKNNYQIQTNDPGAVFSSSDSHIKISSKGLITRLTSAEVVAITVTWKNGSTKTFYALGATDTNQDAPYTHYQGALATDPYGSYLQGWKTLQQLPISGQTYAIVLRHADASHGADWPVIHTTAEPANWWLSSDSTLARQLNPQGVDRAGQLGQIFKDLNYPIKRVITSEFNRAKQTAILMNIGPTPSVDPRVNHLTHNVYLPSLYLDMVSVLTAQPVDNNMTLIIAHHPINELNAVTGYPSFPNVSPFNWTSGILIKVETGGSITYEGAVSWGMFKAWRNIKLNKI